MLIYFAEFHFESLKDKFNDTLSANRQALSIKIHKKIDIFFISMTPTGTNRKKRRFLFLEFIRCPFLVEQKKENSKFKVYLKVWNRLVLGNNTKNSFILRWPSSTFEITFNVSVSLHTFPSLSASRKVMGFKCSYIIGFCFVSFRIERIQQDNNSALNGWNARKQGDG